MNRDALNSRGGFNPDSAGHWCEITKDIIAIANSGGGVILFGVDSVGTPTECDLGRLAKVDPSDVTNKILKYTGFVDLEDTGKSDS